MSVARHHADWLSLIEVSGPFLSMPVLLDRLPQGLDAHDPDILRSVRREHELLEANPALHRTWIQFVLKNVLEFPAELISEGQAIPQAIHASIPEHGEYLRPDYAILEPEGRPRLLLKVYPRTQNLEKPVPDHHWKASPDTRMMQLLRESGCKLGLITNGEHWMLVYAPPRETTGYASWYASLWLDEHATLRAFRTLLSAQRFFSVADTHTLEGMLAESATNQQEVTNQLGLQVREAVTVLIQALDRADQDNARGLLHQISEADLYEAALTVMMRLVFLFSAEERGLLLLGDPAYDQTYAVSTLQAQLREAADQHGEELLERRRDAWSRLLATFRAVHGGIDHERLRLPAYGGHLFNPDRFPFLEGRSPQTSWRDIPANPLPVDNRTVLHLLEALQYLRVQSERRRLSFRALDIEQIGHVYEGLLDHTAKRAHDTVVGLICAKDKSALTALSQLEHWRSQGEEQLIEYLREETGRSERAITNALASTDSPDQSRYQVACGNDEPLWKRVRPFAGLIRNNTFEYPLIVLPGSVYVTTGADRRTSGSHYTPRSLTEPVVQYTFEPLVYDGPAEGKPREQWKLRTPRELLNLKICDMATGSGAFLVQACRYLSELLVEAWERTEAELGGKPAITPYGNVSTGAPGEQLIPKDTTERLVYARRLIAERCLYGVDKNPLAVEMAKLSLWLVTLDKGRAFTFLDHAIKCGDSLLGLWNMEQIQRFHIDPEQADKQKNLWGNTPKILLKEALALRQELASFSVYSVEDSQRKADLLTRAEAAMDRVRTAGDLLVGAAILAASGKNFDLERRRLWDLLTSAWLEGAPPREAVRKMAPEAAKLLNEGNPESIPRRPFHWPIEFPEVFLEMGGFDAIIGNPPFMGGSKITNSLGTCYRDYLVSRIAKGRKGKADLCAYFVLRAQQLGHKKGAFAFILTNSISDGDGRVVCLEALTRQNTAITRAEPDTQWPGSAGVTISKLWFFKGLWNAQCTLKDRIVPSITPFLEYAGRTTGSPFRLRANSDIAFRGTEIKGPGFLLTLEEAESLLKDDPTNQDIILPYITGEDLNQTPGQVATRMVINFHNWDVARAKQYKTCFAIVTAKVAPYRATLTEQVHEADYWKFWDKRLECYERIRLLERVLVRSQVGNMHSLSFVKTGIVFSHKVLVFGFCDLGSFGILQSSIHEEWARKYSGAALRTDMCYSTKGAFETYPFPQTLSDLSVCASELYDFRKDVMSRRAQGLTTTYNMFHDAHNNDQEISVMRTMHAQLDRAVIAAYEWRDLALNHDFHKTKQGVRFTISESARSEVLDRLLSLNHERYAQEVAQGLHDKKAKKKTKDRISDDSPLFEEQEA